MPASRSPIGTPTRVGSSGPGPVSDISPASPWAIWSSPARPPWGPSCPNPLIERVTNRALSSASTSVPKPSRARVPGRKFSSRTSARRSRAVSTALSPSSLRSRVIDSLVRLVERKDVDSRSAPSGCTNGGPQPRVSSPLPGFSTLMTRAPRSPSIIAACGPARARVRSTTRTPSRGPVTCVLRSVLEPAGDDEHQPRQERTGDEGGVAEDLPAEAGAVDGVRGREGGGVAEDLPAEAVAVDVLRGREGRGGHISPGDDGVGLRPLSQ